MAEINIETGSTLIIVTDNDDFINDVLGTHHWVTVDGGAGNDTIWTDGAELSINGGAGNDVIRDEYGFLVLDYVNTVVGGEGDDVINVRGHGLIDAGEGHNYVSVGSGTVCSGAGNDTVIGGRIVDVGDGNDYVSGGQTVNAGAGNDYITDFASVNVGTGSDTIVITGSDMKHIVGFNVASDVIVWSYSIYEKSLIPTEDANGVTLQSLYNGRFDEISVVFENQTLEELKKAKVALRNVIYDDAREYFYPLENFIAERPVEPPVYIELSDTTDTGVFVVNVYDSTYDYWAEPKHYHHTTLKSAAEGEQIVVGSVPVEKVYVADTLSGEQSIGVSDAWSVVTTDLGDVIYINGNNTTINAGGGNDVITNDGSNSAIQAGSGNDSITNNGSNSAINAGTGNDEITNSSSSVTIDAGDGDNSIYDRSYYNTDHIVTIKAGDGNNYVYINRFGHIKWSPL